MSTEMLDILGHHDDGRPIYAISGGDNSTASATGDSGAVRGGASASASSASTQGGTRGASGSGGSASGSDWSMPENFRGKSAEDIARSYTELEAKLGQHTQELGSLRDYYQKSQTFINEWQPLLSRVGYRTDVLAGVLDRVAAAAAYQGDRQGARDAAAAADQVRRWADISDPNEQESYMTSMLTRALDERDKRLQASFGERLSAQENYLARFGETALRAMEAKTQNPSLSLEAILQHAARVQQQPIDPIAAAVSQMTAPEQFKEWLASHDKEQREAWDKERSEREATTFVGAGAAPRPFRPLAARTAPPAGNGVASPPPVFTSIAAQRDRAFSDAKARALPKLSKLLSGTP